MTHDPVNFLPNQCDPNPDTPMPALPGTQGPDHHHDHDHDHDHPTASTVRLDGGLVGDRGDRLGQVVLCADSAGLARLDGFPL